ncbi:MAG: branched-chain amino acid ABC transporter permease [Phycisphaerales bacterium]
MLRSLLPLMVMVAVALVMELVVSPGVGKFYTKIFADIAVAVVLAVSLTMVNGFTGQFSMGHAGFAAVGAYAGAGITFYGSLLLWGEYTERTGFLNAGEWLFAGSCVAGGLVAAALGYVVGLPSLRLRGDYLAIVTLGFGEIVRVLLQQTNAQMYEADEVRAAGVAQLWPPPLGGAQGFSDVPSYTNLFWAFLFAGLTMLVAYRLKQSSTGRAMLSIRENEIAAQSCGVNATALKVRAFVIAAFFAGIAGSLMAHQTVLSPKDAGFQKSFEIIIMVVLGGLGSISGAVLAAVILTAVQFYLQEYAEYRMIIYSLLLIGMMLVRPQGLFGVKEVWELRRRGRRVGGGA